MKQFQLTYEFEELALGAEIITGIEWTFEVRAYGRALIDYDGEGEWTVADIEIAATREIAGAGGHRRWVDGYAWLDRKSPLFQLVAAALLKSRCDEIEERIVADADLPKFDQQREWGTLNRVQQGV